VASSADIGTLTHSPKPKFCLNLRGFTFRYR